MIRFVTNKSEIDLQEYTEDTTLTELSASLEDFRLQNRLKTRNCKGCGKCCSDNIPVLGLDLIRLQEALCPGPVIDRQAAAPSDKGGLLDIGGLRDYLILPDRPEPDERKKAVKDMAKSGMTFLEASVLYEYNNSEPVIMAKQTEGECLFLKDRLCFRYDIRPYSCGLYLCNMGEKLSYLQEMIIRQGTWHAYYLLGWIPLDDIKHNPFLKADTYDRLLVKDFEFGLEGALNQLFFYF